MSDLEDTLPENLARARMTAIRAEREARRREREFKRQRVETRRASARSVVYVVTCGQCVKIGHSIDARKRIAGLQVGSPHPLEIVLTCPGGRRVERLMHQRFAEYRISGEWFRLEGSLLEFIETERVMNPACKTTPKNVKRAVPNDASQFE